MMETPVQMNAVRSVTNRTFWYVFTWLLPLALVNIRSLPRPWVRACGAAAVVAIVLSAYHNQPQDAGASARALFNIAGPMLSLSAALTVHAAPGSIVSRTQQQRG